MIGLVKKIKNRLANKALVLMYHRIVSIDTDPWELAVTPDNFEEHLQVLSNNYQVLPAGDLAKQFSENYISNRKVYITFDDTYTDNYLNAIPLLNKYKLPATFFVPAFYINKNLPFWWDELERIFLSNHLLPKNLNLTIANNLYSFHLEESRLSKEDLQKHYGWTWDKQPPTERCKLFLKIWSLLKPLLIDEIILVVGEIKSWANFQKLPSTDSVAINYQQLDDIISNPLFDVGIHTNTHLGLAFHDKNIQRDEIVECKNFLQKRTNKKIDAIAYPYGSFNDDTLSVVTQENINLGFTTQPKCIAKYSNRHSLGRFQVTNVNGETFRENLKHWFKTSL